jgi:S-DNA-T family DNA segregation ATPase FtsK/SpoIIIE
VRAAPVDLVRWGTAAPADVLLGRGPAPSTTELSGSAPLDASRERAVSDALARLTATAEVLRDAPVHLDVRPGIGFAGPRRIALASARACILQLARSLPPSGTVIRIPPGADWEWMLGLPHRVERRREGATSSASDVVVFALDGAGPDGARQGTAPEPGPSSSSGWVAKAGSQEGGASVTVALGERVDDLPHVCRQVVVLGGGEQAALGDRRRGAPLRPLRPEFASATESAQLVAVLRSVADAEGQGRIDARVPASARFSALETPSTTGLSAIVGAGHLGPVELDLVADGPHAVVGGATGSGKSELLITWVLAMAAGHPPQHVTFLLVDFKGGASFGPVAALPHCVGVVTDLDAGSAVRALESLSAEVLHRERALAGSGVRAIDDLPPGALPRLVIVVDEFAAMSRDLPGLHALFVDLAARGRSLGIHLVLATQRPSDTLRESILANCPLRISLRVSGTADSLAVIGTPEAARLPRRPEGRALISHAGDPPVLVQIARSTDHDRAAVEARWPTSPVRRPWCEPLPAVLRLGDLPPLTGREPDGGGLVLGLLDLPSEQRQGTAAWDPEADGPLLVLGGHRSGRSTVLAALAEQAGAGSTTFVPDDVEGAWDAVAGLVSGLGARADELAGARSDPRPASGEDGGRAARHRIPLPVGDRHLVLVDDVDALVARFGVDHQAAFADLLVRLLRDGPASGLSLAITVRQVPVLLHAAAALCPARLVLRLGSRQDHVLAGVPADRHDERMPPGRGFWRGDVVQIVTAPMTPRRPARPPRVLDLAAGHATAIVSTAPRRISALLAERAGVTVVDLAAEGSAAAGVLAIGGARGHTVVVGSPDAWQGAWTLLGALRARVPLVFDGCTLGEFRSLSRSPRLPPPIDQPGSSAAAGDRHVWVVTPDDRIERARLPDADREARRDATTRQPGHPS